MKLNSQFSILTSHFSRRCGDLERLDTGDYTPEEYDEWLEDMRLVHGFFGELRALRKTLLREIDNSRERRISILDVGAGSGYLLGEIAKRANGRDVFLAGVELNPDAARSMLTFDVAATRADALALPFADDTFDHVFCTLLMHHLDDDDVVKLLGEMARVARGRIFAVDLDRDRMAYYIYKMFAPLVLNKLAVEDGLLSILRSRTGAELDELARIAGLQNVEIVHSRLNRLVLTGVGER